MNTDKLSLAIRTMLVATLSVCAGSLVGAAEWPQYRGPNANGTTTEKILKTWPDAGPRQVWKTPLNDGFSTFAVSGGKAATLVLRNVENVKNEVCIALDAETGKELWATPLGFA